MEREKFCTTGNMAFLFFPMDLKKIEDYEHFRRQLEESGLWKLVDDREKNRYIFRYITDKMDPGKSEECLHLHYRLSEEELERHGWGRGGQLEQIIPDGNMQETESIRYQIQGVQLFTFWTGVNIIAVQVVFEKDDPEYVATGLYYLKKVQEIQVSGGQTLLEAVKGLFTSQMEGDFRFFPHSNEGTERANVMCMAYEPAKENWKKDLYFLKNCLQARRFVYFPELEQEDENLVTSEDYVWGVTGENLSCLVTERTRHFSGSFYQRFQEEYMLIYVLLLHRKYDLYKIVTVQNPIS